MTVSETHPGPLLLLFFGQEKRRLRPLPGNIKVTWIFYFSSSDKLFSIFCNPWNIGTRLFGLMQDTAGEAGTSS